MDSNVTAVDFVNRRVRHFKEEPQISRDDVKEAIDLIASFVKEDYNKKIAQTSDAEQVLLHEVEDSDEDFLIANAEDILLSLKDIRVTRREAKKCSEMKDNLIKRFGGQQNLNTIHQTFVLYPKKEGSSNKYYAGKIKRSSASENYLKKALLENIVKEEKNV